MNFPKTVKLGPYTFSLKRHQYHTNKDEHLGWFSASKQEISIADDIHEEAQAEVLLHELLHSCWYTSQFNQDKKFEGVEEQIVATLSISLMAIFKNNSKLKDVLF